MTAPEELFQQVVARYRGDESVTPPGEGKGFGAAALKVNGKIFALLSSKRELAVKLPRDRVDALIEAGTGTRFDPGHGRLMKEWLAVGAARAEEWPALADEARDYVSGPGRGRR
jgi:hypothetical protein